MAMHFRSLFYLILVLLSSVIYAAPHQLINHYSDLLNALSQGDSVRAIISLDKCSLVSKKYQAEANDTIASMNFNTFNQYKISRNGEMKNVIATSNTQLVMHSQYGFIYHYVRLHIFEDDAVELHAEYVDPRSYVSLFEVTYHCPLNSGTPALLLYTRKTHAQRNIAT